MKIKYIFEKVGSKVNELTPNSLWLDVGNDLKTRIFDNHSSKSEKIKSTFSLICNNRKLVNDSINELKTQNEVYIHIHENPDFDCLFSSYYFELLLNNKELPKEIIDKFEEYIEKIDSGYDKRIDVLTFYALYAYSDSKEILSKIKKNDSEDRNECIRRYIFENIDNLIKILNKNIEFDIFNDQFPFIKKYKTIEKIYLRQIATQNDCYDSDLVSHNLENAIIKLYDKENKEIKDINADIWHNLPIDKDSCYLISRSRYKDIVTFVPQEQMDENSVSFNSTISLPPSTGVSLLNYAKECEIWEQYFDYLYYLNNNVYRRNYNDSRNFENNSHFSKSPFCETDNPWFVTPSGDLVASPRNNSLLDYEKLIFILRNLTNKIQSASIKGMEEISISSKEYFTCLDEIKNILINNDFKNTIPVVKIIANSSISEFGYGMMDYFFAHLIESSIHDLDRNNILRISSNLSVYVSQKVIVVFKTIRKNSHDDVDINNIFNEINKILLIRKRCLETSNKEINQNILSLNEKRKEIIKIQNDITNIQQLNDTKTYEACLFVKQRLNIDTLFEMIINNLELEYNNKRNDFYELFQPVSIIIAVFNYFSVISSFIDFRFENYNKINTINPETEELFTFMDFIIENGIQLLLILLPVVVITIYSFSRKKTRNKIRK